MRYSPAHRIETKAKIVLSARKLFNRFGFDGVSVQQIMAGAGLTHGGFYRHFASKADLYAEVLGCFFTDPQWNNSWEGVHVDLNATDAGRQIVRAYLSRQHFEAGENACPMVTLPSDVARSGKQAKRAGRNRGHGRPVAVQLGAERPLSSHGGAGDRRPVRRRNGHCPRQRGPRLGRGITRRRAAGRPRAWRLEQRRTAEARTIKGERQSSLMSLPRPSTSARGPRPRSTSSCATEPDRGS